MTRTTILAAALTIGLSASAFAGQCPKLMAAVDAALAKNPQITTEQLAEVTKLRAEGETLHKGKTHKESVEALHKAMAILGIK